MKNNKFRKGFISKISLSIILTFSFLTTNGQDLMPDPVMPVPTRQQLDWHDMEMYAFLHYSLNTYTDQEWGFGNEDPSLFNPEDLDVEQWVEVCKNSGMKGIILTAKHHCGFCLWPSEYTDFSVASSPWKEGKGDVVKELADACNKAGLKFAVYLSPWDRNHPEYGREEYVEYFRNQLNELLSNYGDIFEVWFDGANGGNGWYGGANEKRQITRDYYEWPKTYAMIRELQPDALIWNDAAGRGDLRWVGNEKGSVGETNWNLLKSEGEITRDMLRHGVEEGDLWIPGETNTSIRPGWFYHVKEDDKVKRLSKLMETYYKSVGRNSTLLLNFPIMPSGRIHPTDSLNGALMFEMIKETFANNLAKDAIVKADKTRGNLEEYAAKNVIDDESSTFWAMNDGELQGSLTFEFPESIVFDRFLVEEYIPLGQRVKKFSLEALTGEEWVSLNDELSEEGDGMTTIGHRRIICFPEIEAKKLRFSIEDSKAVPLISRIGIYNAPEIKEESELKNENLFSDFKISYEGNDRIIVDLDKTETVKGIGYLPPQDTNEGIITHYSIWVLKENDEWEKVASGEFSNIVNNPILQTVEFKPVKTKKVRIDAETMRGQKAKYRKLYVDLASS